MKLVLELDGTTYPVTVNAEEETYTVNLNGNERVIDVRRSASGALSLLVDNRSVEAWAVKTSSGYRVSVLGGAFQVEVEDALRASIRKMKEAADGSGEELIKAPMPGMVVELKVAVGDTVEPGEPVIVVEAMKMRNEFGPKSGGRIDKIMVEPGQSVERGTELLLVVSDDEGEGE